MADDEVASSENTPRKISLSTAAEELANELIVLRNCFARLSRSSAPKH